MLIIPHIDYCSQLWTGTLNATEMEEFESPQRAFTKRVAGLRERDYWDRLKILSLLSIQRRVERYKVLYTQKCILGLVPNYGVTISTGETRRGRTLIIPPHQGTHMRYRTLKEKSLIVEGPRLYNSLPRCLREHCGSIESFKLLLDRYLSCVPDQPSGVSLAGSLDKDGNPSNSIRDWVRTLNLHNWMTADMMSQNHLTTGTDTI